VTSANDLLLWSQGAAGNAIHYLSEVLGARPEEDMAPELHQAFVTALLGTIALLEGALRQNLRNPEAWRVARQTINDLVEGLSKKILDKNKNNGTL